jgi:hypothetical protein
MTEHRVWGTIHPSVFSQAAGPAPRVAASPRPYGALRYQCPVTGSLVLITDAATLSALGGLRARIRCMVCGDMHLLARDEAHPGLIVAEAAKP